MSPSKYWHELATVARRGLQAGVDVGLDLYEMLSANNNWRKRHGLPMYHRNRPSIRRARKYKFKQWETEHEEG